MAIRIEALSKSYRVRHEEQQITLAEQGLQRLRHPFRRAPTETFWALSDVDLEITRGEVLGLIGRNGAGKSTLLKILSRITPPTRGHVELYGRVGSLLEVGTGFHPELTGRENVYLNGAILGMKKAEIDRRFDEIVEFAGVQRFLDTPVKRYSSGMHVRLAFAVAAHLETEILLVDEVLAVGDQEFQEKCIGKMRDVTTAGRTVILVSHNVASIRQLAQRCVLLDRGAVSATGDADHVINQYRSAVSEPWTSGGSANPNGVKRAAEIVRVELVGSSMLTCGEPIVLELEAVVSSEHSTQLVLGVTIYSLDKPIGSTEGVIRLDSPGPQRCVVRVSLSSAQLVPGHYTLSIGIGASGDRGRPGTDHMALRVLGVDLVAGARSSWIVRNWQPAYGSVNVDSEMYLQRSGELARR